MTDDQKDEIRAKVQTALDSAWLGVVKALIMIVIVPVGLFLLNNSINDKKASDEILSAKVDTVAVQISHVQATMDLTILPATVDNTRKWAETDQRREDWIRWRAVVDQEIQALESESARGRK